MSRHGYSAGGRTGLGLALFFGAACYVGAYYVPVEEEPQFLRLRLGAVNLMVEAEQRVLKNTMRATGESSDYRTKSLAPSGNLALDGSLYHPNLLTFDINGQIGYEWIRTSGSSTTNEGLNSVLQNYDAHMRILREKPYAATLNAGRSTYVREYDFFNTVRGEQQRYGGSAGYTAGPVPFTLSFQHLETLDDSVLFSAADSSDTVSLGAQNQRQERNRTVLSYVYTRYRRESGGLSVDDGTDHSLQVNDTEVRGAGRPATFETMLNYHNNNTSGQFDGNRSVFEEGGMGTIAESLNLREHILKVHTPSLSTIYDYTFDRFREGSFASDNHRGEAGFEHRLYQSLTSRMNIHAGVNQSSDEASDLSRTFYGLELDEAYMKQLGAWGRLSLGYHAILDHQDYQASGGSTTMAVFREPHTLSDGAVALLNLAQVESPTIRVTDATGLLTYRELLDYEVRAHGERTEIRRVSGGTIPEGATVLVDYRAANLSSASGEILSDTWSVRLDLFQGLLGLYARRNASQSFGEQWQAVHDYTDQTLGAEMRWQGLGAGAEYQTYDSDLTAYRNTHLFQSYSRQVSQRGRLGLNADEYWIFFPASEQRRANYQFTVRFGLQLTAMLSFDVEAGKRFERGDQEERDLTTVRAGAYYQIGLFAIQLSYDREGQTTPEEEREQDRLFLRIKRAF
ncbi:MAG: hypothetical protein NTV49_05785 [Kiritimatiellaeota bacterium]|nr:hypothetical protein [Kiritimatiellota bacterium]